MVGWSESGQRFGCDNDNGIWVGVGPLPWLGQPIWVHYTRVGLDHKEKVQKSDGGLPDQDFVVGW